MKYLIILAAAIFASTDAANPCLVLKDAAEVTSCLSKLQAKLAMKKFSFLPSMNGSGAWTPSFRVDVTYDTPNLTFNSCCKKFTYGRFNKMIDPLEFKTAADSLMPVNERTAPSFSISAKSTGTQGFPANKTYTLLMVDPDVPFATAGTVDKPLAHWLILNIKNTAPAGDTKFTYRGPAPPDKKPHGYYFMVYEQGGVINSLALDMAKYAGSCSSMRCLFEVKKFTTDNNLLLMGVTYFMAMNDPYTNYTRIKGGGSEKTYCADVPEYSKPCSGANIGSTLWLSVALSILSYLLT